ncbi:MAG: glycosyltransferase family 4 protein [Acidobacteria bacterium]|nr:glycosyltransferase family 4 protein [Acidobacteriota bacterium]
MRIAWLSPLSRRSGVSRYTVSVVDALRRRAEVTVFAPPVADPLVLDGVPVAALTGGELPVAGYDAIVYNLGNDVEFHAAIFAAYLRHPGVVVLHDARMLGFFIGYALDGRWGENLGASVDRFAALLRHYAGNTRLAGLLARDPGRAAEILADPAAPRLFEPCLWHATGALVHSREMLGLVAERHGDLLPAVCLEHPFYLYAHEYGSRPLLDRRALGVAHGRLLVVSQGRINATKRIHVLLAAVAGDPQLRSSVHLAAVGATDRAYRRALRRQVAELGLEAAVTFVEEADDHLLHSWVAAADIGVNLRFPATETASGSLLEQLHFGRPVIVTRTSHYDELPDDAVVKVDPADEERSLRRALLDLAADPAGRERLGARGAAWARAHCDREAYAEALLRFLERVVAGRPAARVVDGVATELARFADPGIADVVARRAAAELARFLV